MVICDRARRLPEGEAYLAAKQLGPIFSASINREIEQWIADENLLLLSLMFAAGRNATN